MFLASFGRVGSLNVATTCRTTTMSMSDSLAPANSDDDEVPDYLIVEEEAGEEGDLDDSASTVGQSRLDTKRKRRRSNQVRDRPGLNHREPDQVGEARGGPREGQGCQGLLWHGREAQGGHRSRGAQGQVPDASPRGAARARETMQVCSTSRRPWR